MRRGGGAKIPIKCCIRSTHTYGVYQGPNSTFLGYSSISIIAFVPSLTPSTAEEAVNHRVLTHQMPIYIPPNPSASVPPEIWLQIFRTATYIPGEWTIPRSGPFVSWGVLHRVAYRAVLPLRRTIVQVSRLWWEIGCEVLYASFHDVGVTHHTPVNALDLFE